MRDGSVSLRIDHPALESRPASAIGEVRLTDRGRIAVVLQGAALMSHLASVQWRLESKWNELKLDGTGLICGALGVPGLDTEPPQARLARLVEELFHASGRVVGKGQAKGLADRLLQRWRRYPWHVPVDRLVTQLLDAGTFLWQPTFSTARGMLAARSITDAGERLLVAGRSVFVARVLESSSNFAELQQLLMSEDAQGFWRGQPDGASSNGGDGNRLDRARELHFLGHWQAALDCSKRLQQPAAVVLRAACLQRLGRQASARKLMQGFSAACRVPPSDSSTLVDAAVDVYLALDMSQEAGAWIESLQARADGLSGPQLALLSACVAVHCRNWQQAERDLVDAEGQEDELPCSWRRHRVKASCLAARGDLQEAECSTAKAIRASRRLIPRPDVVELWLQLSRIRTSLGSLGRAAKAASHALRLSESMDDQAADRASRMLIEIRLRQGRVRAVASALELEVSHSGHADRPGRDCLEVLGARLDLVRGRPAQALERLRPILNREEPAVSHVNNGSRILAARALGWLGRGAEARELLNDNPVRGGGELDPEEYPALWALAGDWVRARESVPGDGCGRLWRAALEEDAVADDSWETLRPLEALRAARLVFDLQMLFPGKVPEYWLDRAGQGLRGVGADSFAERLDRRGEGAWRALEDYLRKPAISHEEFAELFTISGYFDVRLEWSDPIAAEVIVPGRGGSERLTAGKRGGELVLSATAMDAALRALFALAVRDYQPSVASPTPVSRVKGILGRSTELQQALVRLERLAVTEVPVLIQGETGTGKELAARQLHRLSARSSQHLVAVNCAALSESLLLSDLFGHVRGAFTGADRDRAGVFETARGGTVLLDEIGDLPLAAQGKLLRVLQEGEMRRVGESLPRHVDVRIVAATHRELEAMVKAREFRSDLYYRLKVGSVTLPPLRSRERDVLLLADHFVGQSGCRITSRARQLLLRHHWPGNVRELRNVLLVAMALGDGVVVDVANLELPIMESSRTLGYHQQVEEFRRGLVANALAACDGQRAAAARRLDVSRQALSYLVKRFGLDR